MKTKPLFIAVCVLAVLTAFAWWRGGRSATHPEATASLTGQKLLSPDVLRAAARIRLSAANDERSVLLAKQPDGSWILPEYHGMPVDFEKLSHFTRNLLEGEVARHVTSNPERLARLELGKHRVVLLGEDGRSLWELEAGSNRDGGGQFYPLCR